MGKKKNKNNGGSSKFPLNFSLPEATQRWIWGIFSFVLAAIYVFAFFQKAGNAGQMLYAASDYFFGKSVFLVPLLLVFTGFTFFRMAEYRAFVVVSAFLLSLVGINGILGTFSRTRGLSFGEISGFLGYLVSWPLFAAFGFWVSEIIFVACLGVAAILFWNVLPHEKLEKIAKSEAVEKVKKIFEPKFEIKSVEEAPAEPKIIIGAKEEAKKSAAKVKTGPAFKKKNPEFSPAVVGAYKLPPFDLLESSTGTPSAGDVQEYSAIIKKTLQNFDIPVEITEINVGPTVTQYSIKPADGIKLTRITGLSNDLALALAAHPIRIEAPIPGKSLVGIEVPNKARSQVRLRSMVEAEAYQNAPSPLTLVLGQDVAGNSVYADLARMPHLLVAGATGAGKTIGLNNIILSLLYHNSPYNLKLILVDPKRVEFPVYNDLPHLLTPVIVDTQRAINALKWLIKEMERRFQVFSEVRTRDIKAYHALYAEQSQKNKGGENEMENIPYIVVVIDELADLMAARGKEMEGMIVRLAQMARAIGIHLVLATQRPSVEVITGLIKANITARVAFQVASQIDSRTILDAGGAEKLLGQGDMLFVSADVSKPKRIQGAYVSDKEVKKVVGWIAKESGEFTREEIEETELVQAPQENMEAPSSLSEDGDGDPLYEEAKRTVVEYKKASASLLQRRLKIGYARAARLLDILEAKGVIGPGEGAKPREVFAASQSPSDTLSLNDPQEMLEDTQDALEEPGEVPQPAKPFDRPQDKPKDSGWFSP